MAAGSEAAPGLPFLGDLDTGFYQDDPDTLSLSLGGANFFTASATPETDNVTKQIVLTGGLNQLISVAPSAGFKAFNDSIFTSTVASGSGTSATDIRMRRERLLIQGANAYYKVYGDYIGVEVSADVNSDSGSVVYNHHLYDTFASGTIRTANVVFAHFVYQAGSTTVASIYQAGGTNWATGGGTTANINGLLVSDLGHATRITNQLVGVNVADQTDSAAASAGQIAFLSNLTPRTNGYGFRDSGGAQNAFKGPLRVGNDHALASPSTLDVTGTTHLDGDVTLGGLFNPVVNLALTGTAVFTDLSDAATTTPLTLINGGASAGTAVQIRLAPKEVDLGALRAAQIVATYNGGAVTLAFQTSNGAAPVTAMTINPVQSVSFTQWLELTEIGTPSAPASSKVVIYEDIQAGKNRLMARFSSGAAQVIATQP